MRIKLTMLILAGVLNALCACATDNWQKSFTTPPDATRPRCYWYWMDGHITKEGITQDLEAMKRVGIGEGYIGIISGQSGMPSKEGPQALTPEWWEFVEHAVREGGRLGVDIGFFNSPGWSQSGGPWVKPEQAMRYVTLPETRLHGPQHFEGKLPSPVGKFQDMAVLAFPAPEGDSEIARISERTSTNIHFQIEAPFTARSLTVLPIKPVKVTAELQTSDDGVHFRTVKNFVIDRHNLGVGVGPVHLAPVIASLPATTARYFRLTFSAPCELGDVQLSTAARVDSFAEKSLIKAFQNPHPPFDFYSWPAQTEPELPSLIIQPSTVLNLTKMMAADGLLHWDVPAGEWIVLRAAMVPTGTSNGPAPAEATGPEVDKMNRSALKAHFDSYVGDLLKRIPASDRKALKHVVADSYEQGPENWTDGFGADFQKRYGYSPLPWLPVLTGRIVGSADKSDRFLWDLRRMVADRIADDYVGGLRDLCHQHGLKMWLENYGHWGFPGEFLQYGGECDEIGGEFWANGNYADNSDFDYLGRVELRDASSAAHIYGKTAVWAEAFTGGPAFANSPHDFKARGDWAFCEGINQFVFHVYIHQPWDDKLPGVNAWFGTEFNRHNTWFEQSKAWIDYLRRCSVMLQTGQPVADVAYFIGEDTPKMTGIRKPELPSGRDFDFINSEVIEKQLTVKNDLLTLPSGMTYRVLVLPELPTMRPEVLRKIRDLIKAGATVVGRPPERSPSMENFPKCDEQVKQLARDVWGETTANPSGEHQLGKGRVVWGKSLDKILAALDSKPDFEAATKLRFKHRRTGDTDIYFVANPQNEAVATSVAFRANGRVPELWWPDSGRIERPAVFEESEGALHMPLSLGPAGSVFVVFREKLTPNVPQIVSVTRNGTEILGTKFTPQDLAEHDGVSNFDSPDNFAFAIWAKPDADTALTREANTGVVRFKDPRNEVLPPPHGDTFGGKDHAGSGLAVGRNGVCVLEHGANYFVPTLVYPTTLTNWTHVAVVYRDGQPSLYLNGVLAKTGLKSSHIVHSGAGHGDTAKFVGKLGSFQIFASALSDAEVAVLAKATPPPVPNNVTTALHLTRDAVGKISARVIQPGDYEFKFADEHTRELKAAPVAAPLEINGPWEVSFAPGWGAPDKIIFDEVTDWTKHSENDIKYFSGQATYCKTIEIPAALCASDSSLILNLGDVGDLATVRVNGREVTTLWIAPWQVDITPAVKPGANTLEISVVNSWNNRLAGDAALPPAKRRTFVTQPTVKSGAPLLPAGLLGPVTLQTIKTIDLK